MTWFWACVSYNIPRLWWDKYHLTSCPLKNDVFISIKHAIWAVVHLYLSRYTDRQHCTDFLSIVRQLETPTTCHYIQRDLYWVDRASWLLLIPFWIEADNIFLTTSNCFSSLSSSSIPQHQIMATQTPPKGASRSESSSTRGASTNAPPRETQQCRKCCHSKCDPRCGFEHCNTNRKKQEWDAACHRMWANPYRGRQPSANNILYSWCT